MITETSSLAEDQCVADELLRSIRIIHGLQFSNNAFDQKSAQFLTNVVIDAVNALIDKYQARDFFDHWGLDVAMLFSGLSVEKNMFEDMLHSFSLIGSDTVDETEAEALGLWRYKLSGDLAAKFG